MLHPDQIADRQLCDVSSSCVEANRLGKISHESAMLCVTPNTTKACVHQGE